MIQAQDIYNAFALDKRDIDDVGNEFLQWVKFTVYFIWDSVKRVDAKRFIQNQLYSVVTPPQTEALPSNFENLNQTDCGLYYYDTRKRSVVTFDEDGDSDVTFSDTGGTSAYNSNIKVQGYSSRGYTGDAAATMNLSFGTAIDWTDFGDAGANSPSNDYISIYVYVGNTVPSDATIEFSTLNTGADVGVNQLSYTTTSLVEGWNHIKIRKSAFTLTGTADWDDLGYLRLIYTGGDATTNVYWDKLQLVENEINGKDQTDNKLGITRYGSTKEGYYLEGPNIVFTGDKNQILDQDYMMRFLPEPPTIDALSDYITIDKTADTAEIVEDRHLEYMTKAVNVLYEQWDNDPEMESIADFRFVRALGGLLDGYNRQPQISIIRNSSADY